jgi:hypothetical protein
LPNNDKFVRDGSSGALLNTDKEALEAYKRNLELSTRVQSLEKGMGEIKDLLITLINNKK